MKDINYLKRLFQDYYRNKLNYIPEINSIDQREFGFIPWDDKIFMFRHESFNNIDSLKKSLQTFTPRHVYTS